MFALWKPIIEIVILCFVIYHIMRFFEGTVAVAVLRGIAVLLIMFFVFQRAGLERLDWLFTKLFAISIIAILVIFHPEIRQGLARLGRQRYLFGIVSREEGLDYILREIVDAIEILSRDRIGALIAIEKEVPLKSYVESGVRIDGLVSSDCLQTIFTPNSLLHDGGVIIREGRLAGAGCLFPLTQDQDLSRIFGTRHRAAVGLSEETDAVVVVVSEERGNISLAYEGRLYHNLKTQELLSKIKQIMKLKGKVTRGKVTIEGRIIHWFTYHPWLKVVSLILAILSWFYISGRLEFQ
jgi:diadenylate cyclase